MPRRTSDHYHCSRGSSKHGRQQQDCNESEQKRARYSSRMRSHGDIVFHSVRIIMWFINWCKDVSQRDQVPFRLRTIALDTGVPVCRC